ncbi:MAG TPA: hypothetical protein VLB44_18285 [Kofleriaceae bacterium]|nr:hypothetical protein [Kofleriaceae bacterium]
MKRALLMLAMAACVPDSDPPWQIDHDRIVAVRSDPPAILPGEIARLDVLVAHAGGPTTIEQPLAASAPDQSLYTAVHFYLDHWQVDGPDEMQLAAARAELGLADGAPVPLDITLRVAGPLYAQKRVLLGATAQNPILPNVTIDGAPAGTTVALETRHTARLLIEAPDVRWLTSCGELADDHAAQATLVTGDACTGELVVVARDGNGGVAWQVWPLIVN